MRYQIEAENLLYKMHLFSLCSLECKGSKSASKLPSSAKIENSFKHLLLECDCVVALPAGDKLSRIRPQSVNMLIYKLSPYEIFIENAMKLGSIWSVGWIKSACAMSTNELRHSTSISQFGHCVSGAEGELAAPESSTLRDP